MTMNTGGADDQLETLVGTSAHDVHKRFSRYVSYEELAAEAWLYVFEHPSKVAAWREDEDEKRGWYRLRRDVSMAIERYARASKAHRLGYDIADEVFYSAAQVRTLLPMALFGHVSASGGDSEIRAPRDRAEGGETATAVLDVRRAWELAELTARERQLLVDSIVSEMSQAEIGAGLGVDQATVSRRLSRAMRKMIKALGGVKPRGCPYDCECHEGPLRRRPGVRTNTAGRNQDVDL